MKVAFYFEGKHEITRSPKYISQKKKRKKKET